MFHVEHEVAGTPPGFHVVVLLAIRGPQRHLASAIMALVIARKERKPESCSPPRRRRPGKLCLVEAEHGSRQLPLPVLALPMSSGPLLAFMHVLQRHSFPAPTKLSIRVPSPSTAAALIRLSIVTGTASPGPDPGLRTAPCWTICGNVRMVNGCPLFHVKHTPVGSSETGSDLGQNESLGWGTYPS
jgi:hypothetical protein